MLFKKVNQYYIYFYKKWNFIRTQLSEMTRKNTYLGIIATILVLFLFGFYLYHFGNYPLSNDHDDWAKFGAYIGGVSSALLAFITVWLLDKSLNSQNDHSNISQFELSFFELIRLHKSITNNMKGPVAKTNSRKLLHPNGSEYTGLGYIEMISLSIDYEFDGKYDEAAGRIVKEEYVDQIGGIKEHQIEIDKVYDNIYKDKETILGHYFRSLYHLVKFVNESNITNKQKYVDLIQAYLTDSELHIVFYNAIGRHGRTKFKPLLDDYNFFENISSKGLFFDRHFKLFYPKSYSNFKSKIEIKKNT